MTNRHPSLTWALLLATLCTLPACGGGGDSAVEQAPALLPAETAQGYGADAGTMPVTAANALDAMSSTLESALASAAGAASVPGKQALAAAGDMQAQATSPTVNVPCPGGGSLAWTISGGTLLQQLNGQLDAGERYDIVFSNCQSSTAGLLLDGVASLGVTTRNDTATDLALEAKLLRLQTPAGQFVLDGGARAQRSAVSTQNGGATFTTKLTSTKLTLASTLGARQANYELQALDWTVTRTLDASGAVTARSHQGAVNLLSSTPRRPAATLAISTQGSLSVDDTGLASQGSLTLRTATDTLTVVHGAGQVTLTLDAQNNGTIDRTWTLPRATFNADAG